MPKKLFEVARFSRQSAIRACFYEAKRAGKTSAKTCFAVTGNLVKESCR